MTEEKTKTVTETFDFWAYAPNGMASKEITDIRVTNVEVKNDVGNAEVVVEHEITHTGEKDELYPSKEAELSGRGKSEPERQEVAWRYTGIMLIVFGSVFLTLLFSMAALRQGDYTGMAFWVVAGSLLTAFAYKYTGEWL